MSTASDAPAPFNRVAPLVLRFHIPSFLQSRQDSLDDWYPHFLCRVIPLLHG